MSQLITVLIISLLTLSARVCRLAATEEESKATLRGLAMPQCPLCGQRLQVGWWLHAPLRPCLSAGEFVEIKFVWIDRVVLSPLKAWVTSIEIRPRPPDLCFAVYRAYFEVE